MKAASMGEGKKSKWKARSSTRHCWGTRLWRSETYLFRESPSGLLTSYKVKLDEVVKLVSYDNTIAAQCLRVASSPLFGLAKSPESIRAAVITLGLRRVETILLTCCLGDALSTGDWALDPTVFWKHSLVCAMVCRKFSEKLGSQDGDKAYMAGLLHNIGFIVNCIAFPKECAAAAAHAAQEQISFDEAEGRNHGIYALRYQTRIGREMTYCRGHGSCHRLPPCTGTEPGCPASEAPCTPERFTLPHARHGLRILRTAEGGFGRRSGVGHSFERTPRSRQKWMCHCSLLSWMKP